mmetsp:Transcript_7267/g.27215  ORF Transcript_7267/g.27215 Transcript_7267/m.27215 type:complete len:216 (+) Transcript_7267:29-676(+)
MNVLCRSVSPPSSLSASTHGLDFLLAQHEHSLAILAHSFSQSFCSEHSFVLLTQRSWCSKARIEFDELLLLPDLLLTFLLFEIAGSESSHSHHFLPLKLSMLLLFSQFLLELLVVLVLILDNGPLPFETLLLILLAEKSIVFVFCHGVLEEYTLHFKVVLSQLHLILVLILQVGLSSEFCLFLLFLFLKLLLHLLCSFSLQLLVLLESEGNGRVF